MPPDRVRDQSGSGGRVPDVEALAPPRRGQVGQQRHGSVAGLVREQSPEAGEQLGVASRCGDVSPGGGRCRTVSRRPAVAPAERGPGRGGLGVEAPVLERGDGLGGDRPARTGQERGRERRPDRHGQGGVREIDAQAPVEMRGPASGRGPRIGEPGDRVPLPGIGTEVQREPDLAAVGHGIEERGLEVVAAVPDRRERCVARRARGHRLLGRAVPAGRPP